MFYINGLQAI